MSRAGFSRRLTSRPQMKNDSYQGATLVAPNVALCSIGGGLQPAEVNVCTRRSRLMPKRYDHGRTPAACSEIRVSCSCARLTEPERRMPPIANPYSHTWIRISQMVSATYEQFSAKPLKINGAPGSPFFWANLGRRILRLRRASDWEEVSYFRYAKTQSPVSFRFGFQPHDLAGRLYYHAGCGAQCADPRRQGRRSPGLRAGQANCRLCGRMLLGHTVNV